MEYKSILEINFYHFKTEAKDTGVILATVIIL